MKICLTGGGTAGHVTPNIALFPKLKEKGFNIFYIGSRNGIEKQLIEAEGIEYNAISSGKLRRYLDFENVKDIFKVVKGIGGAYNILKKQKPDIIFSKGGFVTVPVCVAGHLLKIPVVIHESDISPGLANKISLKFAKAVCVSFPETLKHVKDKNAVLTGTPIRSGLFTGDRQTGKKLCGFTDNKPVILVIGGSSGSVAINKSIYNSIGGLLKNYNVAHICGKGNLNHQLNPKGYKQFEYLSNELPSVLALADVVVSRAGANAIFEFLALKKPNLLIPLTKAASRGDQLLNADSFKKQGFSHVLHEEDLNEQSLVNAIDNLYNNRYKVIEKMNQSKTLNSIDEIINIITKQLNL